MITKTDVFNSYQVQFVFDYSVISTTVFAMHEDAAIPMASGFITDDLGIREEIMDQAQDIVVELLDRDVL
jgi:hypothetical protein